MDFFKNKQELLPYELVGTYDIDPEAIHMLAPVIFPGNLVTQVLPGLGTCVYVPRGWPEFEIEELDEKLYTIAVKEEKEEENGNL